MRFVVLSGRTCLVAALMVFLIVIVRRILVLRHDFDPLPFGGLYIIVAVAVGYLLVPLIVRTWLYLTRPDEIAVARSLDDRLMLNDLLASGLTAAKLPGRIAEAVARQAGDAADRISPTKLYPVKRSLLKTLAVIPLLAAAAYMLGLPTADGMILMAGPGGEELVPESPEEPVPDDPTPGDEPTEPVARPKDEPDPEDEPQSEQPEPPKFEVRVVPSKKYYESEEPIVLFVLADALDPIEEALEFDLVLVLDGEPIALDRKVTVSPGKDGGGMIVIDALRIKEAREKLKGGMHKVSGILKGGELIHGGPEEEFEVEGDDSGGNQDSPQPQPQPQPPPEQEQPPPPEQEQPPPPEPEEGEDDEGGEDPPPPTPESVPRFVNPLFDEGEIVKKKGWALVPDPEAPAGSAPRRLPLAEAAREAAKRPESAVPLEKLKAGDADTVSRYFELLRSSK